MSYIPTIGDVVREFRRDRQISLTDFSRRTGLSKGYISGLEHNKIDNPKSDKLKRLAAALRISERDIVSRRMPHEVKDGNVASKEDVAGFTLVEDGDGQTAVGQPTQKASSSSTVYGSPLSPSNQEILVQRLAVLEKMLCDAHEELRETRALVARMQKE